MRSRSFKLRISLIASLQEDGTTVWERLKVDGTTPEQPIEHLFALNVSRRI
jgi:hypothetical protein